MRAYSKLTKKKCLASIGHSCTELPATITFSIYNNQRSNGYYSRQSGNKHPGEWAELEEEPIPIDLLCLPSMRANTPICQPKD